MNQCPKCKETSYQRKCGKTTAGSQRYNCKHCNTKYTPVPKERGYPDELRHRAIRFYMDGMNYRRIARHLNVHNTTVSRWVKAFAAQLPDAPLPEELRTIELDELFTFIETKKSASTSSQLQNDLLKVFHKIRFFKRIPKYGWVAVGYLLLLGIAESLVALNAAMPGLILHTLILATLLLHSALASNFKQRSFLLTLSLAPLIRLISLMMPLNLFPIIYWYAVVAVPLFVTTFLITRMLGITRQMVGLTISRIPLQLLVGISGLVLGYIEYIILRPTPLISTFRWELIWLPALILFIFTGLFEELIFRGLLQSTATSHLGRFGIIYISAIFAELHMGYHSILDLVFVFGVGLFFGYVVRYSGSILGVTVAHGLINITLYLLFPFILAVPAAIEANVVVAPSNSSTPQWTISPRPQSTYSPTLQLINTPTPLLIATVTEALSTSSTPEQSIPSSPTVQPILSPPTIWGNCSQAIPARLVVGMRAEVISSLYLRIGPGIGEDILLTNAIGDHLEIIGGPVCLPFRGGVYRWWQVKLSNGMTGWSAEGSLMGTNYFLSPLQ